MYSNMTVSALLALLISTWLFANKSDARGNVCENMQPGIFSTNNTVMKYTNGTSSPLGIQGQITLECCFKSPKTPNISWYHGNKQIGLDPNSLSDGFNVQASHPVNTIDFTCSRIMKSIIDIKKTIGIYTCEASAGRMLSNRSICVLYSDTPQYAAEVEVAKKVVRALLHSNVTLSCTLTHVRRLNDIYEWFFRNQSLISEPIVHPRADSQPYVMDLNTTIVNVTEEKLGEYKCWAWNGLLKADEDITILELETVTPSQKSSASAVESPTAPPKNTSVLVAVAVLGSLFAVVLLLGVYKFEKKRRRYMLNRNMHRLYEQEPQGSFQYDLFLSCSSENGLFAQEYLLPLLESPPYNLKVCYHHRDFLLGRDVLENMADAVYKSCKILIIISDNYLTSEYCKYEMDAALYRQLNENNPCVALIRRGAMNKKLPQKLKAKNFLDLTNNMEQSHIEKRLKTFVKDICGDMKEARIVENSPA